MEMKRTTMLRPSGVSREYGIPEQTLANWRHEGRGPAFVRLSARHILYDRADIERHFAERKVTPTRRAG